MSFSSLLAKPLIWLVRGYQVFLSPLTPPSCRYYPSCSAYAVTALERFGPVRGTWMAVRRVGRCHPWAAGGVDHVPLRDPDTGRPVPGTTGPRGIPDDPDSVADPRPHTRARTPTDPSRP